MFFSNKLESYRLLGVIWLFSLLASLTFHSFLLVYVIIFVFSNDHDLEIIKNFLIYMIFFLFSYLLFNFYFKKPLTMFLNKFETDELEA
jgi:hypothetical protein